MPLDVHSPKLLIPTAQVKKYIAVVVNLCVLCNAPLK